MPKKSPSSKLPRHPKAYEINTWVWLADLSGKYRRTVDLGCVPAAEWDAIAECGFDAVWLMGVWERSPAGIAIANRNPGLLEDFRRALPDFRSSDNAGSPYCIRRYVVDATLGGDAGLATARKELAGRGLRLILDFVPNHVAPDHPWATGHPEYFIQGTSDDARNDPASFVDLNGRVFSGGPYLAWPDVLQLSLQSDRAAARNSQAYGPRRRRSLRHGHAHDERHLQRTWAHAQASGPQTSIDRRISAVKRAS
jgi:hypothetical protein